MNALAQNNESKKYLKLLGVKKIKVLGNLKFSKIKNSVQNKISNDFKSFSKNRKLWCASSTHDGEEFIAAQVHKKLKDKYNNLLTIIIPRHINRAEKILNQIQGLGLKTYLHSSRSKIKKDTEIYLVDTYGETENFFKICRTVFLGGSLIRHGGQNPLEPSRLGCKVIHGPHTDNFKEIYRLLDDKNIAVKINNMPQLASKVNMILKKKINSTKLINELKKLGNKILFSTIIEIKRFI